MELIIFSETELWIEPLIKYLYGLNLLALIALVFSVIFVLIYFLVLVNKFVIFSFFTIFVFVFLNENHTACVASYWTCCVWILFVTAIMKLTGLVIWRVYIKIVQCLDLLSIITLRSGLCYHKSICRLSSVTFVHCTLLRGWNFRQYLFAILYLIHPLTSVQNFTEIVPGESLRRGRKMQEG